MDNDVKCTTPSRRQEVIRFEDFNVDVMASYNIRGLQIRIQLPPTDSSQKKIKHVTGIFWGVQILHSFNFDTFAIQKIIRNTTLP